jgi:SAM-dependent methyltransferase
MRSSIRAALKAALVPLLYRYPPYGLKEARLAVYLSALLERAHMPGDVAEIGCNLGGTSIIASRALKQAGWEGRYICYDTFGGFLDEQYDADVRKGLDAAKRSLFSANSKALVRKILRYHKASIELVQADATKLKPEQLSRYSVVLSDIDLSEPSYQVMKLFWDKLVPGGIMFCDDCYANRAWLAGDGYKKFCDEFGLPEEYAYGLGIVRKP